ncbi:hypothetical protein K1T71_006822 [Dendrolimus kikuchii]|uniref:Uncharacterized protein n=1 Tax=Dendrolimus kikuchii TaxID=765133 RepID=A0ACC1D1W6_9NEOP|nr:hypothetical protein K1T71_006822 [Dendrolimus kikuchii]
MHFNAIMKQFVLLCLIGSVACQTTPNPQEKNFLDWINGWLGGSTTSAPIVNDPPVTEPASCPVCQCGLSHTRRRIVGGSETIVTQYAWIVALLYNGKRFYCGGSIINDLYALTAAHCTAGFRKERIVVRLLEHDRSKNNETQTIDIKVAEIIRHPRYNPGTYDNDIALLKLAERVDFSSPLKRLRDDGNVTEEMEYPHVRPVCLPEKGMSYSNYTASVIGWGTTEEGGSVSDTLQQVDVTIMSNMECRNTKYGNRITDNMLCAGVPEGGKDACQGDSGGPLQVEMPDKKYQEVGVVSWGEGCARPNVPGVYTRVNRYMTWIKSNTKDACYCS